MSDSMMIRGRVSRDGSATQWLPDTFINRARGLFWETLRRCGIWVGP